MHKLTSSISVGFFLFIVWIIYLANTGASSIFFDFVEATPYGDKFGHAGLFGFLTLVAVLGLKSRTLAFGKIKVYYGAALVIIFVIGEELSQAFIASRTFDYLDLLANMVGISLAVIAAFVANKRDAL